MPESNAGLEEWLGVGVEEFEVLKQTRDELRDLAKANSLKYTTGTVVPILLQDGAPPAQ